MTLFADITGPLARALIFAADVHKDATYGDTAYVVHPLRVASQLDQAGWDEATVLAGLLHDVLEDSPTPVTYLAKEWGEDVGSTVLQVTQMRGETYAQYIDRVLVPTGLEITMGNALRALAVKRFDMRENHIVNGPRRKYERLWPRVEAAYDRCLPLARAARILT